MDIWLDNLSIKSFFLALRKYSQFKQCREIKYFNSTRIGKKLFSKLFFTKLNFLGGNTYYWEFALKDNEGKFLFYPKYFEAGRITDINISDIHKNNRELCNSFFTDKNQTWIRRFIWYQLFKENKKYSLIMFIFKHFKEEGERQLFLEDNVYKKYTLQHKAYLKYKTDFYGTPCLNYLDNTYKFLLKLIRISALTVLNFIPVKNQRNVKKKIGINHCWGIDQSKRSDIFWKNKLDNDDILIYFNDSAHNPSSEVQQNLKNNNYLFRILKKESLTSLQNSKPEFWYPGIEYSLKLAGSLFNIFKNSFRLNYEVLMAYFRYMEKVHYLEVFFKDQNVKINFDHWGVVGDRHVIDSLAIEKSGGANIRATYSYRQVGFKDVSREFHTFFSWGPQPAPSRECLVDFSDYIVNTGFIFDKHFPKKNSNLNPKDILLFDSNDVDEGYYEFYYPFVNLLNKHKDFTLHIKSKCLNRDELVRIVPEFDSLIESRRIKIYERSTSPHNVLQFANLSIVSGANSAGIEAALAGLRVVHWIPDKSYFKQLHEADNKVLSYDMDEVISGIEEYWTSNFQNTFGDHSPFIDQIDPFRDGNAANRIEEIIINYLNNNEEIPSRDKMRFALNSYAENYGKENVLTNHS